MLALPKFTPRLSKAAALASTALARSAWGLLAGTALAQALPAEVDAALARAKMPREAVAVLVADVQGKAPARVSHRANVAVNPASVMKLVTTSAALDLLGPGFAWVTQVFVDGAVQNGTLSGNLVIKGQGDPKLVSERLWLLLRRVQGLGIKTINGDILLDRTAFETVDVDPASFDGEPLRPYNAAPDALLVNFKSVVMTFVPDHTARVAQIQIEPPLAGVQMPVSVPLGGGNCADYRGSLKADFSNPAQIRFLGNFPAACGEKVWPVAYADPKSYAARAVEGMWHEMGGKLTGTVREGRVPPSAGPGSAPPKPTFEIMSPPLPEVIRDINKYSNNVMAQQLFLTLSLQNRSPSGSAQAGIGAGTLAASRELVQNWWRSTIGEADVPVLDNGSGLSRSERISALALGKLLQNAYASPWMPELMSSLPITGVDGTTRSNRSKVRGSAHLKTGTLSNVSAIAGYVLAHSGQRYVVVMVVNHPGAAAAKPAMDALLEWAANDR